MVLNLWLVQKVQLKIKHKDFCWILTMKHIVARSCCRQPLVAASSQVLLCGTINNSRWYWGVFVFVCCCSCLSLLFAWTLCKISRGGGQNSPEKHGATRSEANCDSPANPESSSLRAVCCVFTCALPRTWALNKTNFPARRGNNSLSN